MVAVITGVGTLEMATRAKTQLILILVELEREDWIKFYAKYQKVFQAAADRGLVELAAIANENKNESESKCNPCCAIS